MTGRGRPSDSILGFSASSRIRGDLFLRLERPIRTALIFRMTAHASTRRLEWILVLSAAAVLMITTGARLTTGLFLAPINASSGLGIVAVSFAMAVGQFMWGLSQPFFGAVADKYGPGRVIVLGGLLLAVGTALTTLSKSQFALIATLGILSAAGAGAGSFSTLIGAVAQRVGAERRAFTSGVINAGGSAGQLVYAPVTQALIASFGWTTAMLAVAASTLATLPLAWPLRRRRDAAITPPPSADRRDGLWPQIRTAMCDRSYLCLHAGFFTCGFHIAFLVTHMPGEVELCGLPVSVSANSLALIGLFNIVGSLSAGALSARYRMKHLLALLYASRAVIIAAYLVSPKTSIIVYVTSVALGLSWLATVPPTAGLVGKLFGTQYLSTLFGLTLVSHQTGAFFGAWLGGIAVARTGSYQWMWYTDIALALAASVVNFPIREAPVPRLKLVPAR